MSRIVAVAAVSELPVGERKLVEVDLLDSESCSRAERSFMELLRTSIFFNFVKIGGYLLQKSYILFF